jgi:hypothetical protein
LWFCILKVQKKEQGDAEIVQDLNHSVPEAVIFALAEWLWEMNLPCRGHPYKPFIFNFQTSYYENSRS